MALAYRATPLWGILTSAAQDDPTFAEDLAKRKAGRLANQQGFARLIHEPLRDDPTPEQAADVIYAIASPQLWELLAVYCGWPLEQAEKFLGDALRLLLPQQPPTRHTDRGAVVATILLCSTPLYGHAAPLLAIGQHLVSSGHRVILLTGTAFKESAQTAGLEFVALAGRADFDERDEASFLPDLHRHRGLALSRYQVQQTFIATIPDQYRSVREILNSEQIDVILTDSFFAGILPILETDPTTRARVIGIGIGPLVQISRDVAPFNTALPPSSTFLGRLRNRALNLLVARVLFARTQRLAADAIEQASGTRLRTFVLDLTTAFDRFVQLGPAEFEYPRTDLTGNIVFAGPVERAAPATALPKWWNDLDGDRPIVHVTQGTLDNHDLSKVIRPTLDALADEDVLVIVSTGRTDLATVGPLPANARAAEFIPYDLLLPRTDVMVTNGGYGGTLLALRHGVPLVVAGAAEDKPEVAARVAHFGVGINLRTGRPTTDALRTAVTTVLRNSAYRDRAAAMATAINAYEPLAIIEDEIARLEHAL